MAKDTVRADTPDPTKYFPNRGIPGTMIPRAGLDGQSMGFDHNRPQKVIVDPGEAGGGFELDIAALAKHKKTFNAAATKPTVASDVTSFYRELSQRLAQPEPEPAKEKIVTEPIKPLETLAPIQPLPALAQETAPPVDAAALEVERLLAEQAQKAAELKRQYFAPTVVDPMQQQIVQQATLINTLIERVNLLSARPPEPKDNKPDNKPEQDPGIAVAETFASLQIPFLSGDKAARPEYETYFEMSKMGTMAARYHAVVPGQSCLALIYDTRFVDGFQYLPPSLGEERIKVSVPKLKQTYSCSSLGLHWSLGCLDVVILILHNGDES